jgi:hypothetical protein
MEGSGGRGSSDEGHSNWQEMFLRPGTGTQVSNLLLPTRFTYVAFYV